MKKPLTPDEALVAIKKASAEDKIKFADVGKIDFYAKEVKTVLAALATITETPGIARAWVSDLSSPHDFGVDASQLKQLADKLKIKISDKDLLWEIAQRINMVDY